MIKTGFSIKASRDKERNEPFCLKLIEMVLVVKKLTF